MPGIQRFDLEGDKPLTERELRRRWASFHGAIRFRAGAPPVRELVGRMLGEGTIRYRVARFFGRPILQLLRAIKGQEHTSVGVGPKRAKIDKSIRLAYFPMNYRPRVRPRKAAATTKDNPDDVTVVTLDDNESAQRQIDAATRALESTAATWLLLCDASASEFELTDALAVLTDRAEGDDDVVFADEAGLDPTHPILKSPAVGPHTLLSYNVVGRPALLRVDTLRSIGGFSLDAGRAFEHDAMLRLSEANAQFHHVADVLGAGRPPSAFAAERIDDDTVRVVGAALERRGWKGAATASTRAGVVRWRPDVPTPPPSIDVIIPTRDRVDLMRQCIGAIEEKTTYPNYDIIILDNDSTDPETLEYMAASAYRVVPCPGPFNYAHIVNRGVSHSRAEFIVTLNNDTILITPDWLEIMVGLASLPDVGFVGGCLIDQDGYYEHESIVISPYPQHLRSDSNYPHADDFIAATRDVAAVTGAVQMVRREVWESLGGMDEQLRVTMNDVDICLRSQLDGLHVVYSPDVRLHHHVSSSRGKLDPLEDRNLFIRRWDIFGRFQDPYFPESILLLGEQMYYRFR